MIRQALGSLPAGPGAYIAVALAVIALAWHYAGRYQDCTADRELRRAFHQTVEARGRDGRPLRLAEVAAFAWDRVEVQSGARALRNAPECPLGWNWPSGARDELIAAGRLARLFFVRDGRLARMLEARGDRVEVAEVAGVWTREAAVFEVARGESGWRLLGPGE